MRRIFAVLAGMILMFGLTWAVELADFQPHMKKAGRGVKALKKQLKEQDGAGAAKSAKAVATHFDQDFHFGPGTVTGYTPAAPNTTSFRAEPCTSPPPVGARARPSAHRR